LQKIFEEESVYAARWGDRNQAIGARARKLKDTRISDVRRDSDEDRSGRKDFANRHTIVI
jgi:hypothetical protein